VKGLTMATPGWRGRPARSLPPAPVAAQPRRMCGGADPWAAAVETRIPPRRSLLSGPLAIQDRPRCDGVDPPSDRYRCRSAWCPVPGAEPRPFTRGCHRARSLSPLAPGVADLDAIPEVEGRDRLFQQRLGRRTTRSRYGDQGSRLRILRQHDPAKRDGHAVTGDRKIPRIRVRGHADLLKNEVSPCLR
jgi:hypothetical protein